MTEKKEDFCAPYMPLIEALLDKHATEVSVHNLSELSGFADVFIVAARSAGDRRHTYRKRFS